ncbi:aminotransferase class IV [Deinococcus navajonensis]|uniref:Aminotransferase class IV n=1 Tax=Deinococcus navajonensis TaxID=309884 RepID=A0ABV8XJ62_9DEIO
MKPLPAALDDPAWLHGESVFTTLRTRAGQALHWPAHRHRLEQSCAALGLPAPDPELPSMTKDPWGLARVTVTRHGTFFSQRPLSPGPRPRTGVHVRLTSVQVHPQLAGHKTGNYLPSRLAAQEADGAFEAWMQDTAGHLADGSRTSPLLDLGGEWVVPAGGLPGITRALFLSAMAFTTRQVHVSELGHVRAAWICGSGVGVVPVARLDLPVGPRTLPVRWPDVADPALRWPDDS